MMNKLASGKYGTLSSDEGDLENMKTQAFRGETASTLNLRNVVVASATVIGLSFSAVFLVSSNQFFAGSLSKNEQFASAKFGTIVTNEYTPLNLNRFDYSFLKNAVHMEPWKDNNVEVTGVDPTCSNAWILSGKDTLTDEVFSGSIDSDNKFIAVPKKTGYYSMAIKSSCGTSLPVIHTQNVVVKYVRRDVTTLIDADREEFLDALRTLWDVDTITGQKLYGEKYKSLYYFATIHNDGGANAVCDEFHRNSGFINAHVYIGAYLEQSLQLVNPRTALHYWEYTRDFSSTAYQSHFTNQLDGGAWTDIMTSKFFGTSDPSTGEILTGRWAHTEMPRLTDDFMKRHGVDLEHTFYPNEEKAWLKLTKPHITSPYGFLRSPWNFSPSDKTLRFHNAMRIPSGVSVEDWGFKPFSGSNCANYKAFITSKLVGQPLFNYLQYADAQIHGYTHYTTGGSGGDYAITVDAMLREKYSLTDQDLAVISVASARYFKTYESAVNLDKVNPVLCNGVTPWNVDTQTLTSSAGPGEEGGPACTMDPLYGASREIFDDTLADFFVDFKPHLDDIHVYQLLKNELPLDDGVALLKLIFSRMQIDGDMSGSGSATDPLFWVAHGAVERLFQRAMFEDVMTDKIYVTAGAATINCVAHQPDSTIFWLTGFEFENKTVLAHEVPHKDLIAILDPTGDQYATYIPFIYDSQDFDWCDGFDDYWHETSVSTGNDAP